MTSRTNTRRTPEIESTDTIIKVIGMIARLTYKFIVNYLRYTSYDGWNGSGAYKARHTTDEAERSNSIRRIGRLLGQVISK